MFDVPPSESVDLSWDIELPIESLDWQIGLIVGPSGSGKSTIARECFPDSLHHDGYDWPKSGSILDGFPSSLEGRVITEALSSVGFSSPPHWLKSWHVCSNGQKFRADLARVLLEDVKCVVFDEFTSVVDRDVAKVCCAAVSKTIRRRRSPRLVAVSCHYDILDWLQPDWVYDVGESRYEVRSLRRRPPIDLAIHSVPTSAWAMFRGHHYLTASLAKHARCFVGFWRDRPVAFTSYVHFPHAREARFKMEHRTVVLPDFQGVGIGNAISRWLGEHLTNLGWRFISTTSHPAMIRHRSVSTCWRIKRMGHVSAAGKMSLPRAKRSSIQRLSASFEFIPEKKADTEECNHSLDAHTAPDPSSEVVR